MDQPINSPLLPTLYTARDVANHCQVSERQVRRWISHGQLQSHKIGRRVRISSNDLALFLSKTRKER
jgi:excisionase family DNA binding protein